MSCEGLPDLIEKGALHGEVDAPSRGVAFPDRDLARHEWRVAVTLQRLDQVAQTTPRLVDLVDEDHVRHPKVVQPLENGLQQVCAGRIGFGHHDGEIDRRQDCIGLGGKIDRAGAIQHRVMVAQIIEARDVEFGGELTRPRLIARIANRAARRHRSLAVDRTRGMQHCFHQGGFPGPAGTSEGDRTCGRRFSSVHCLCPSQHGVKGRGRVRADTKQALPSGPFHGPGRIIVRPDGRGFKAWRTKRQFSARRGQTDVAPGEALS